MWADESSGPHAQQSQWFEQPRLPRQREACGRKLALTARNDIDIAPPASPAQLGERPVGRQLQQVGGTKQRCTLRARPGQAGSG
jgi:hypothetical protein